VLATFHEKYEKLMSDYPDAKEMDPVRPSVDQIGKFVQNSPKMNDNDTKRKQLADSAEADRRTFCNVLLGQALFTGLYHMYTATYKEMRDSFQPSSIESGQEDVSQAEQNKRRKGGKKLWK
jgi:hypothetical protein